jgi:PDZ domain-containing protein
VRRLSRLPVGGLLAGGAIAVALALFSLWVLPSPDYLYLPNRSQPLEGRVKVDGGHTPTGPGGIYYLDVTVRQATWMEHLFAFTRPDGATLVPKRDVVPTGSSFDQEHRQELAEMDRSEQIAAAVALRNAGLDVKSTPTGVLVELVAQDAPAARVLRSGDLIVSVNGAAVTHAVGLRALIARHRPGDVLSLGVRRDGTSRMLAVRTVSDPENPQRPVIGITIAQGASIKLPIGVKIDLGGVGGPSAGLPFALDVLELLGHNVDHGLKVAATGELDLDGSVRPIGGVKQKTFGARQAGVDVLLVPAGENAAVARRYAGSLRVVPVESFQQALRALATIARSPAGSQVAAPSK